MVFEVPRRISWGNGEQICYLACPMCRALLRVHLPRSKRNSVSDLMKFPVYDKVSPKPLSDVLCPKCDSRFRLYSNPPKGSVIASADGLPKPSVFLP